MSVYLRAKFQISSVTLMSFRQGRKGGGVILTPVRPPQNETLKIPPRLGISVKIWQPLVKIQQNVLNHHLNNEAINTWLKYILELRIKARLLLAFFFLDICNNNNI